MAWKTLLLETFREWSDDNAAQHSAALAFYTMFSLAPLLIITVSIAGAVFGEAAARGELQGQMAYYIGDAGAETVQDILEAAERPAVGTIMGLIGLLVLLFGASGVFAQLQTAMDVMFDVPPDPNATWVTMLTTRFFSFTMVLGTGFLLLVSLVVSAVLTAMVTWLGDMSGAAALLVMALNLVVGLFVTTLLFAAIFRFVPRIRPPWSDVWPGALLTAVLFSIGRIALGWYLGSGSMGSAYGAAASLVIVLAWVYYSAQILFLGAEFTQVYAAHQQGRASAREPDVAGPPTVARTGQPPRERLALSPAHAAPPPPTTPSRADGRDTSAAPIAGYATLLGITALLAAVGIRQMR
jgi:membrane protein